MRWPSTKFAELFRVKHGYAFKSRYFDADGPHVNQLLAWLTRLFA